MQPFGPILNHFDAVADVCNTSWCFCFVFCLFVCLFFHVFYFNGNIVSDLSVGDA